MTSLRRRIFIGSLLWTVGMIVIASAIFSVVVEVHGGRSDVAADLHGFLQSPTTLVVSVLGLLAGALQVRRSLARVDLLRSRLADVRSGHGQRLDGDYPSEIQPLVDDLNGLLETRERAIERAVAKAGDLAHGLKTPLAILAQDASQAEASGQTDLARSIHQQVTRMQRHVDYHLAQARAAASGSTSGARTPIADAIEGLRRALARLHAERGIRVDVEVDPAASVRVQREDFEEMVGNLLDNACKWSRSLVVVRAALAGAWAEIVVDDDGPGIGEAERTSVLQRGARIDQAAPGTGLGLAIVRDLAELYGGSISLERSPEGGLRARLRLPA